MPPATATPYRAVPDKPEPGGKQVIHSGGPLRESLAGQILARAQRNLRGAHYAPYSLASHAPNIARSALTKASGWSSVRW